MVNDRAVINVTTTVLAEMTYFVAMTTDRLAIRAVEAIITAPPGGCEGAAPDARLEREPEEKADREWKAPISMGSSSGSTEAGERLATRGGEESVERDKREKAVSKRESSLDTYSSISTAARLTAVQVR